MARNINVDRLAADQDVKGLIKAIRSTEEDGRAKAAQALGEIGDIRAVESLIRAHLQDPAQTVQAAALGALQWIIGTETQAAISTYQLPDDPWIQLTPDDQFSNSGFEEYEIVNGEAGPVGKKAGGTIWDEQDIQGLMATIRVDQNMGNRIKAIQALSQIEDTRAIDALASIALWSEERKLRESAREVLANVYGDSLEEVLQSYRDESEGGIPGDDVDDEEDDYEGDEEDEEDETTDDEADEDVDEGLISSDPPQTSFSSTPSPIGKVTPVIQEENTGGNPLLIVLFLVALAAIIVYLLTR
jgi:hypothetical protein